MKDYIKYNSKTYVNQMNKCVCFKFQSYERKNFGQDIPICNTLKNNINNSYKCNINNTFNNNEYIYKQQNLYALMRRKPELFPIITTIQNMNLSQYDKRRYSNMWYKQFGTSQALPVNDNWGGFYLVGSDVPYTN